MQQALSLFKNTVSTSPLDHVKAVWASSLCDLLQGQLHIGQTLPHPFLHEKGAEVPSERGGHLRDGH